MVERGRERRVVRGDELLRDLVRRLPEAVGESGRAAQVLEVPLDQAPAVDLERGVEEQDRGDPVEVVRRARVPQAGECLDDVRLPADDVERRQAAEPLRRRPGVTATGRGAPGDAAIECRT